MTTLDMSELDDLLISMTIKMADCLDSKTIYGAHIIPVFLIPNFIKLDPENYFLPVAPAVEKIREQVFNEIKTEVGDRDWSIQVKIEEGRPFSKLMQMVKDVQPDLVIFGKKEKSSGSGITAKRVAHNADSDILLVPSNATTNIQKILVPIDFSENSFRAVKMAQRLHQEMNLTGKIDLIFIVDTAPLGQYSSSKVYKDLSELLPIRANRNYQEFIKQNGLEEEQFNFIIEKVDGENIANALLGFSKKNNFQLIVLGAKGHSYFDNFVFGSVAETMMDLTHEIPVMVIR